jgi:hypothetical protein
VNVTLDDAVWLGDAVWDDDGVCVVLPVLVAEVVGLRHDVLVGVRDSELVDVAVVVAVTEKVGYASGSTLVVTMGADALAVVAASPSPGKKEYTNAIPSMVAVHTGSTPLSTETVAPASCVI